MFGASEDRARQLAGRQRWKRINSNGSGSSHRSASSSSRVSYLSHCEASPIFEQNIQWPTELLDFDMSTLDDFHDHPVFSQLNDEVPAASHAEEALSRMMATNEHPRTQQQRCQAEACTVSV